MFILDEEKIECALGHKEYGFWQGKKTKNFGIRCINLSLTLGTAKFKQLD